MDHPDQTIWDGMLAHLRDHHPTLCRQWFAQITPIGVDGGAMLLRAESDVHRDYLRRECLDAFNDAARTATESLIAIRFLGPDDSFPSGNTEAPDARPETPGRVDANHDAPIEAGEPARDADHDSAREPSPVNDAERPSTPGRLIEAQPRQPRPVFSERGASDHDTLIINPDNGFENFVVGPGNRLAHAAAVAVAENPGYAYNPFFVHGDVGLGKTHLLQAICVSVRQARPEAVLHYVSCDTFINDFMLSVRGGQMSEFRHRFRDVDVLVIDDIHFLAERDRTQEEFFHTFNSLYQLNKQIVLSSDAPPEEIPHLEDRLVSRFKWGLVARVDPPGYETRIAILQSKARLRGLDMPSDVAAFVAGRIDTNIRELEGAVVQLQLAATVENQPISLDLARATFGDARGRTQRTPTIDEIVQGVCEHFEVRRTDLLGKRRHQSISLPRQVCMALARKHTRHSFEEIGASIGGRDHTTVMHACKAIESRTATDPDLESAVRTIERELLERAPRG
ncbi:MAG: chromosomal replication initiator protein DnaA [Planctomycetota bacterium]